MIILSIRTDKPDAELGLYSDNNRINYQTWTAHRQLAATLLTELDKLLSEQSLKIDDVNGIICFKGPGSFTGLRIGLSAANALAYSYGLPIVAEEGENWLKSGLVRILSGESDTIALPEYGAPAFTTTPKK